MTLPWLKGIRWALARIRPLRAIKRASLRLVERLQLSGGSLGPLGPSASGRHGHVLADLLQVIHPHAGASDEGLHTMQEAHRSPRGLGALSAGAHRESVRALHTHVRAEAPL